jgi:hypothetical protein
LKPLWLRLVRDVSRWTAYVSLDGTHWMPAGGALDVEAAGVWVGVFVTSKQSGVRIQATFDSFAGFRPSAAFQIGSP